MSINIPGVENKREPALSDTDTIDFGQYQGNLLQDVPDHHLAWLWNECRYKEHSGQKSDNNWILKRIALANYIWNSNRINALLHKDIPTMSKQQNTIVEDLFIDLQLSEQLSKEFLNECLTNACLFDRKQHDYGSQNIGDFGYDGVVVRLNDKLKRIVNLYKIERACKDTQLSNVKVSDESIEDTLRDIANYAIIAIMCRKDCWPKE